MTAQVSRDSNVRLSHRPSRLWLPHRAHEGGNDVIVSVDLVE